MAKINISNEYISQCNLALSPEYPKYSTQVINLANQNANGTRPKIVGQLSEMFPEYLNSAPTPSLDGWKEYYVERYPEAVDVAVERIWGQIENLKQCIEQIDKEMVRTWTEDLIYNKTFNGLYYQSAILKKIAEIEGKSFRLATPEEEAKNIDGFVGDTAYQIKPDTFDMKALPCDIPCKIARYTKKKNGITVEY